jgi:hypothetical protein
MKFNYKRYGKISRPVIGIRLKNGAQSLRYEVLIDSGADMCLFDAEIGEVLGIDVQSGKKEIVTGVGGKQSIYFWHKISIEVGGWEYEIDAGFMPKVAGHAMPYGLVGQKGFFDIFIVKFNLLKGEVEIKNHL